MAKILFINPWNSRDIGSIDTSKNNWWGAPLPLLVLSSWLKKHQHEVRILDLQRNLVAQKGNLSNSLLEAASVIYDFMPDIIAVSFMSCRFTEVATCVGFLRRLFARTKINPMLIGGGIHTTFEPISTLKQIDFDAVFSGEGEKGLLALANGNNMEDIPGFVLQNRGTVSDGIKIDNLDDLPFLDWKSIDYNFYTQSTTGRYNDEDISLIELFMSRGCPYKCNFCAYNAHGGIRYHSSQYILNHMQHIETELGKKNFLFLDSTVGNNKDLLFEFCGDMRKSGFHKKYQWRASLRVNQVDENILKEMQSAGCDRVIYGFESGSQRVLGLMNKKTTVEQNYRTIELHRKLGLKFHASIMLGYPGETENDIRDTFKFLAETTPESANINSYSPLPGCPDYENLKKEGKIKLETPEDWNSIGETVPEKIYCDIPYERYQNLFNEGKQMITRPTNIVSEIINNTQEKALLCLETPYTNEAYAASCYLAHTQDILEYADRLKSISDKLGRKNTFTLQQASQLLAFILEFKPELILDFCGNKRSTAILKYATELIDCTYSNRLLDKATTLIYFSSENIKDWNKLINKILPEIQNRKHIIIFHGFCDKRTLGTEHLDYNSHDFVFDHIISDSKIAPILVDFISRNNLSLFSADFSFSQGKLKFDRLDQELFGTSANWSWLSLNEIGSNRKIFFPNE